MVMTIRSGKTMVTPQCHSMVAAHSDVSGIALVMLCSVQEKLLEADRTMLHTETSHAIEYSGAILLSNRKLHIIVLPISML